MGEGSVIWEILTRGGGEWGVGERGGEFFSSAAKFFASIKNSKFPLCSFKMARGGGTFWDVWGMGIPLPPVWIEVFEKD